jgi:hypothetical protein
MLNGDPLPNSTLTHLGWMGCPKGRIEKRSAPQHVLTLSSIDSPAHFFVAGKDDVK